MSWGEIKRAINSTLGTEDFMPLDEMIKKQCLYYRFGFDNKTNRFGICYRR